MSALEPEVTEAAEFYAVSDEIRRWSSLSEGEFQLLVSTEDGVTVLNEFEMMCHLRILFPLHFVVFKQTDCHLTVESNVEHWVFSRVGQLSEVNLDPDTLGDMVSIMVTTTSSRTSPLSKISWTSTMRCSEARTRQTLKKTFFSPDSPEHSDKDSDAGG